MNGSVERLRAMAHHYRQAELGYITPQFLGQLADEIEQLQGEVARLQSVAGRQSVALRKRWNKINSLKSKRSKWRAA